MMAVIDVIKSTWGRESPEHVFKDFLVAIQFHGGLVLTAEEDGIITGIQVSIPARRNGCNYLYSHLTGVRPDYRETSVGYELKESQKKWALENGYELIAWTFDPAVSKNAFFNIEKLGATSRSYRNEFYGEMKDELNYGIPTDRLIAEWWLKDRKEHLDPFKCVDITGTAGNDLGTYTENECLKFSIVHDFAELKKKDMNEALSLRLKMRSAFNFLLSHGYAVINYSREEHAYLFSRNSQFVSRHPENIFG